MFGINDWQQVKDIAEGWTNYALDREKDLSEKRMKICIECPLYNNDNDRCDASKCINIKTGEMAMGPGKDIVCGCNCFMKKASRSINKKCVLGKW